jgi:Zn ribbon nucleic-acid-binding protein
MEQAFENHSIMRCPVCFSRDIDVLMEQEGSDHYCVKCGFRGPESEVRGMYKDIQKKFHGNLRRFTLEDQRAM